MQKILINLAVLLSLLIVPLIGDTKPVRADKKITCFPLKQTLASLNDQYGEEPMILGITENNDDIKMGVYVNKETGTYTIIEFNRDVACVISVGKNIRYRFPTNTLAPISY